MEGRGGRPGEGLTTPFGTSDGAFMTQSLSGYGGSDGPRSSFIHTMLLLYAHRRPPRKSIFLVCSFFRVAGET